MWACSCFHWALSLNFHLRHTSDLTWAVPSWNDNAGKLKVLSTLKKSNPFHGDKHICRSAALLREMEKWSPLLFLILCVTSHLSPSELLKIFFTVESSLVLDSAIDDALGYLHLKGDLCHVWSSLKKIKINIPPMSCNDHFWNMCCSSLSIQSRLNTAISDSLCWTVGWVCPVLLFAEQQRFPLTMYFECFLRLETTFYLCITSVKKSYFLSPLSGSTLASKGGVFVSLWLAYTAFLDGIETEQQLC